MQIIFGLGFAMLPCFFTAVHTRNRGWKCQLFQALCCLLPRLTVWVLKPSWEMLCAVRCYEPNCSWTPLMTVGPVMCRASLETQGAWINATQVLVLYQTMFSFLPFSYVCFVLLRYFPLLDFNVRIMAQWARNNWRNASLSQSLLICFGRALSLQIPDSLFSLVNTWTKLPHLYLFFLLECEILF